jgi:ABC-type sugar transport system ATPase subunit
LRLAGITKFFGGVKALDRVSLGFFAGEIVALIGDNGAGKSTLVKILSGLLAPDEGELHFDDTRVRHLTPREARRHGIETVHQHLSLCDNLGAAANVVLGQEPVRWQVGPFRIIDERRSAEEAGLRIRQVGANLDDFYTPVRRLSGGQRQAVAIARALVSAHRLIILDEPTAALGLKQTQATLDLVRGIADQGVAVIFISHNLDDVFTVAHRIVAMRLGQLTLDTPRETIDRAAVVAAMTGMTQIHAS